MNRRMHCIKRVSQLLEGSLLCCSPTTKKVLSPLRGTSTFCAVGIVVVLWCMNSTPLAWSAPSSQPAATRPTVRPSKPAARRIVPTTKHKQTKANPTKKKTVRTVECRNRPKYGRFCLGRVIGPSFSNQILRCPHCGNSVLVKKLRKRWVPNQFDSDLRPHFGHYHQKHRVWVCRHCGYAAYSNDFFRSYNKKRMARALQHIRKVYKSQREVPPHYQFFMANAAYVARKKNAAFFAELMLRAVWSMREEKPAKAEKYIKTFRRSAIAAIRSAFHQKQFPLAIQHLRAFQIADLLRQQKQWSESVYWLERSFSLMEKAKKAKITPRHHRRLQRWILQLQDKISKRNTDVFVLK